MYAEAVQSYRAAILHSEGGEKLIEEVEATLSKVTDNQLIMTGLQAALAKRRDEIRTQLAQQRRPGGQAQGWMRPNQRPRFGQFQGAPAIARA